MTEADLDIVFDQVGPETKNMDSWWVARKMGLIHKQRNAVLNRAIVEAANWFGDNGGKLKCISGVQDMPSAQVAFRVKPPRIPRAVAPRSSSRDVRRGLVKPRDPVASVTPAEPDDDGELDGYFAMVKAAAGGSRGGHE